MEQTIFRGYIGTYTKGESEGIYSFLLDTNLQKITEVKVAAKLENPTYLTISKDNQYLYSVGKINELGGLAAFSLNKENGELHPLNHVLAEGSPPCHVNVDSKNQTVLSTNYHKGTLEAYSLDRVNGEIHSNGAIAQHEGSGPDPRQEKAHTHYAGFTPDEKYIVAVELGIDKIFTYELTNGSLSEVSALSVAPGSGPRHLAFHHNGKFAYVMTEFSSEVLVLEYESETGRFTQVQSISTLPAGFTENNQGSAIQLSSDGRFLYVGNRGHNSIAVFEIDQATNLVNFVEHVSTEGDWPRDFSLDPSEKFIVASNQESSNIVLFARNQETGKLTLLQNDITVGHPVCVKFLAY
ncbi:lactonase family protein [Bacillus sp. T3]|uniref:lactonase family protein n=1 Tax=Bacillus sp. T3 TaxID=467262 RepID=UPI0029811553|nr:lactonase family protein [Bacillus sp. T3]